MANDTSIIDSLTRFLDYSAQRQKVISSNIANADTPGYKARTLDFAQHLDRGLAELDARRTRPGHLATQPELIEDLATTSGGDEMGNDGNNVDLEAELKQMAVNVLEFTMATQMLQHKLNLIQQSIKEGRA